MDDVEFDAFVRSRSAALVRTAFLITRDWGKAEDLVQTALAKCWLARRRVIAEPEAYVRKAMLNTSVTWWRRRWRHELPHDDLARVASALHRDTSDHESWDDLWSLVGKLPARQRAVLVLRFYDDLPDDQIAAVLGCTAGTVKSQAARALAKIKKDLLLPADAEQSPLGARHG